MKKMLIISLIFLGCYGSIPSSVDSDVSEYPSLRKGEIESENELLKLWGVKLDEDFLISQPFDLNNISNRSFLVPKSWFKTTDKDALISTKALRSDLKILKYLH